MHRAFAVLITLGGLALATLSACSSGEPAVDTPALHRVDLQLNWKPEPQFGGFYAAQEIGAYERHGLVVEITPGGAGAPTIDMVGAGTVAFGITSGDEIVRARAIGNRVVALFAVYQTNPQGIMTRATRGFETIEDIFSHPGTLAMERGLPYSDYLERRYGFDLLEIVPSPYGDLSLYRIDESYSMQCFVTSEPLAARKIGIEPTTFLIADAGYNPYTTVLATSEDYLHAHPETVDAMVAAVREGWESYLNDPTAANSAMGKLNPTMDAATFAESAVAQRSLILPEVETGALVGEMALERWQALVEQLVELGVVDETVAAEECFVDPVER